MIGTTMKELEQQKIFALTNVVQKNQQWNCKWKRVREKKQLTYEKQININVL